VAKINNIEVECAGWDIGVLGVARDGIISW